MESSCRCHFSTSSRNGGEGKRFAVRCSKANVASFCPSMAAYEEIAGCLCHIRSCSLSSPLFFPLQHTLKFSFPSFRHTNMLYTKLISVAAPLLVLATNVNGFNIGKTLDHTFGKKVYPPPSTTTGPAPPAPDPTSMRECDVYTLPLYSYRMTALKPVAGTIYGDGDPNGFIASYAGDKISLQTGSSVPNEKNYILLELQDSATKKITKLGYQLGKDDSCLVRNLPTVQETRNGNHWIVSVYAISSPK
jgi:hypothetical protein